MFSWRIICLPLCFSAVLLSLQCMFKATFFIIDEQSEVADSAAIGRDVVGKWIDLKNKVAGIKQDKSVIKTHAEITELLDGELDALRSFCTIKISKMRQQLISKQANGCKSRRLQHGFTAKKAKTSDLNCIVPDRLVNTIHLKNIRETVKQVKEAQVHESSVCPDCQNKKAELAKITFLRQKKILMESALIQEKLEEQIYSRDVLTHIGEALRSFPKPSENPMNLWQRLKGQINGVEKKHFTSLLQYGHAENTARTCPCASNLKMVHFSASLEENLGFITWRLTFMYNFHFKCAEA
ncbi:uncharacterized protein C8orf48 homolog isoform X1 [Strix aluco]|uniref:uncharacterized protein C8orf48 homolog isoform X1 n=1 Tax=Strix aluco TaxID=111821 RepID=UPI003DA256C9